MGIGIMLLTIGKVDAQTPAKKGDAYRQTQWNPGKGKYYFSHALIYHYTNKVDSTEGEFWVFLDPVTGTMCFQRESSFGATDEMNEAILALPNGQVIACGKGENGKSTRETFQNDGVLPIPEDIKFQQDNFKSYCVPTGRSRKEYGWESTEHVLSYIKTNDKTRLWLAKVPFGVYPLYAFDEWGGDAQLPVPMSYTYVLGPKQLITELDDPYLKVKLIGYESNPYFLDLTKFVKQ